MQFAGEYFRQARLTRFAARSNLIQESRATKTMQKAKYEE
jgi:hypothetical protein